MFREYLWPHCGWSDAKTGELTMKEQNKAWIKKYQSVLLPVSIMLLSKLQTPGLYLPHPPGYQSEIVA